MKNVVENNVEVVETNQQNDDNERFEKFVEDYEYSYLSTEYEY